MKKFLLISVILIPQLVFGQQASALKTFKNKDTKIKLSTLRDLKVNDNGDIELTSFVKKDKAEKLILNSDLVLQKAEEIPFDFEVAAKKKKDSFWESFSKAGQTYAESEVIKSDVLEVASSDVISKTAGINTVNKGKIGLKTGLGFSIQKGDIQLVTNVIGDRVREFTAFVPKEEIKLKSDEGKNIVYEFHSSPAEGLQIEFNESDTYNKSKSSSFKSFIDQEGDLLLIGNRRPIIKFGKAPSPEDLLPVYYTYKLSPKTMDIIAQSKFAEPVSRGVIYRETLKVNKGIILVSAPTSLVNPKDPNPRNYVFRLIGDDTQMKFEVTHEVPSGFTQFSQVFELADGSIILIGAVHEKRVDKYINQGTYAIPDDAFYVMTIKGGKVTQKQTFKREEFFNGFKMPQGEKPGKLVYNPAYELTKNISDEYLPNGGMLSVWSIYYPKQDNKSITVYAGDIAMQFSPDGKLDATYWIESTNSFKPSLESTVIKINDHEFYWLTYAGDETGKLSAPVFTKIDVNAKTISGKTIIGDEKHLISQKFPYTLTDNGIQFFGFDQNGKEFWTQKVVLK